jgi:hypothetical protein
MPKGFDWWFEGIDLNHAPGEGLMEEKKFELDSQFTQNHAE